jgi:hypothetical protein
VGAAFGDEQAFGKFAVTRHLSVLSVAADPGGTQHLFEGSRTVFAADDVVFAWAIGKALLIVIFSFCTLVYVAWAATYQKKNATHVGISKGSAFKRASSCSLQTDHLKSWKGYSTFWLGPRQKRSNGREPEQPAGAA